MDAREVAPGVREHQLFDQLAKLRREQVKLRERASTSVLDPKGIERLRQIEAESNTAWTGIRSARAEIRAAYRARFAGPPPDPFRGLVKRKPATPPTIA
jgi:hypothetical protein